MGYIASQLHGVEFDKIVAIDARGFMYGAILANKMMKPLVLARKPSKLPGRIETQQYDKEYGHDEITLQVGSICKDDKVLVIDDLLATGQTAHAVDLLVNKLGGKVIGFQFIVELSELNGRKLLGKNRVESIKIY
jgi:adenine phosphoribosyltransferase